MRPTPPKKPLMIAVGLSIVLFLAAGSALADCPGDVKPSAENPMLMLVLGDSIMWGQGLKPEQKFSWRVKCWLQEKTGREVQTRVEAHSGAHLLGTSPSPPRFKSNDGEVNLPYPTINEQVDNAAEFYGPGRADQKVMATTFTTIISTNGATTNRPVQTSFLEQPKSLDF